MDTITHGIAGALISKAVFRGGDLYPPTAMGKRRIITWSLTLGAIFPDSDVFRDIFSRDQLLMLTWHRSITHSLLCWPVWTVLLAALTRKICQWRKWEAPSFAALCGYWGLGLLSHIFLDLITTFGTMVWSPVKWSRPAWDILFIIDFTFTAILLIPQLLAWTYEDQERFRLRAIVMWMIFTPAPLLIAKLGLLVGAPISNLTVVVATSLLAALYLLPAVQGWGLHVSYENWSRAGLTLAIAYLLAATYAHHAALQRVEQFAARDHLEVQSLGALPFPPSLWHWDGLVRVPHGVYEMRMDLTDGFLQPGLQDASHSDPRVIQHTFYLDAVPNPLIEKARQLPEVQKVLWFARFLVTRFHKEGPEGVVEFLDLRFAQIRTDRPPSFVYRVQFTTEGEVLSQGWVRR
jgi:membrane-bound metal-dependent hydrolase YbcI (DUF457 family)